MILDWTGKQFSLLDGCNRHTQWGLTEKPSHSRTRCFHSFTSRSEGQKGEMKSTTMLLIALCIITAVPTVLSEKSGLDNCVESTNEVWKSEHQVESGGVSIGVVPVPEGARVSAQLSKTLWQDTNSHVHANAHVAQTLGRDGGPPTYGVGLKYEEPRGSAAVGVSQTPGYGTQVGAGVEANLWRSDNGRSSLDANVHWSRNYDGPRGTSRPNYGGGIAFTHRF